MNILRLKEKGVGLIEIVIAVAIITASFFAIIQLSVYGLKAVAERNQKAEALAYAKEGMEALRNLRDASWTNNIAALTSGTTYYLTTTGGTWALTATNPGALNGIYTRTIVRTSVQRNVNDDIVASGGIDDPGTKEFTVTVSWGTPAKSVQLAAYFADLFKN